MKDQPFFLHFNVLCYRKGDVLYLSTTQEVVVVGVYPLTPWKKLLLRLNILVRYNQIRVRTIKNKYKTFGKYNYNT